MKRTIRILFFLSFLLSSSLPVFKRETSDFDLVEKGVSSAIEQIGEKTWGIFNDALTAVKDKLFEDEKPIPPSWLERWKERIFTGFGYGFSPIGAMEKAIHEHRFNLKHLPSVLGAIQCILIFVILLFLIIPKVHRYIGILSLSLILVTIYQFGLIVEDNDFSSVSFGVFLFSLPSVGYLLLHSYQPQ